MRSTASLVRVVQGGLVLAGACDVARTVASAGWLGGLLSDAVGGAATTGATLVGWTLWMAVMLGLAVWSYRAVQNAQEVNEFLSVSPGGAAAAWLIPGWNLWKPYDTIDTVWSALANADPDADPNPPGALLTTFWVAWVASIVVAKLFGGGSEEVWVNAADVFAGVASALSAATGVWVLQRLTGFEAAAMART